MSKKQIENQVLKVVRGSRDPLTPKEVVERLTGKTEVVRDTIVSLVDRGKLQVTLDWKLRVNE